MKNYLRNVSQEKQWDIIQQVINQYGHRTEKIVEMVDDGYQVTNELLELLYRLNSVETIKSLMYRIDDSLSSKDFLCTTKMEIFKNALGEKEALELREKIVEERRQEKALMEEQKMQECQTKVEEFHKEYGLKEKFFEAIIQSKEFMKIALEKYNREAVIKGIAKTGKAKWFIVENVSPEELVKYELMQEAVTTLWMYDITTQFSIMRKMMSTEDGFSSLMKTNNTTIEENLAYLAKYDQNLKEKYKSCGVRGYFILYKAGVMTEEEFEQWCKLAPSAVVHYKDFKKSIFWVIKNGYYKHLK